MAWNVFVFVCGISESYNSISSTDEEIRFKKRQAKYWHWHEWVWQYHHSDMSVTGDWMPNRPQGGGVETALRFNRPTSTAWCEGCSQSTEFANAKTKCSGQWT